MKTDQFEQAYENATPLVQSVMDLSLLMIAADLGNAEKSLDAFNATMRTRRIMHAVYTLADVIIDAKPEYREQVMKILVDIENSADRQQYERKAQ